MQVLTQQPLLSIHGLDRFSFSSGLTRLSASSSPLTTRGSKELFCSLNGPVSVSGGEKMRWPVPPHLGQRLSFDRS